MPATIASLDAVLSGNIASHSPRRLEVFGADVIVAARVYRLFTMVVVALSTAKTITFIDNDAAVILVLEVAAGTTLPINLAKGMKFPNGLIFDDSESDLETGDFVLLFGEN